MWSSPFFRMDAAAALLSEQLQILEVFMMSPLLSEPPPRASKAAALLLHCAAAVLGFDLRCHASISLFEFVKFVRVHKSLSVGRLLC